MSRRIVSYSDLVDGVPLNPAEVGPSSGGSSRHPRLDYGVGGEDLNYNGVEDEEYYEGEYDEDYGGEYDEEEEDEDDGDDSVGFMIPDVDEFHRRWDAKQAVLPTRDQPDTADPQQEVVSTPNWKSHRPPSEVGGGGRMLTHQEIWGPDAITGAWKAAMQQYIQMNSASKLEAPTVPASEPALELAGQDGEDRLAKRHRPSSDPTTHPMTGPGEKLSAPAKSRKAAESALWYDAPAYDSLLAAQIKQDTQQILASRAAAKASAVGKKSRSLHSLATPSVSAHAHAHTQTQIQSSSSDTMAIPNQGGFAATSLAAANQGAVSQTSAQQAPGKPRVTVVPSANVAGNHAWRKAVKTVQTTSNRVGVIHTVAPSAAAPLISSLDTGADSGPNHPRRPNEEGKAAQRDNRGQKDENMQVRGPPTQDLLHSYWWAGYHAATAGSAAAAVEPVLPPAEHET
ncbi:hypothetical protein BCV70DRAFT_200896 [Testicularia cyperi]|uniref:Uncharacterized protein n=1 Tax=Testicularia cyperi TaxID=1882483 RepID=A0A317XNC7_9BASI|nr:hypothetical protein BCV70DRAFT_200896 [Testicularia cyperi]